jgi:hypothetical protein
VGNIAIIGIDVRIDDRIVNTPRADTRSAHTLDSMLPLKINVRIAGIAAGAGFRRIYTRFDWGEDDKIATIAD